MATSLRAQSVRLLFSHSCSVAQLLRENNTRAHVCLQPILISTMLLRSVCGVHLRLLQRQLRDTRNVFRTCASKAAPENGEITPVEETLRQVTIKQASSLEPSSEPVSVKVVPECAIFACFNEKFRDGSGVVENIRPLHSRTSRTISTALFKYHFKPINLTCKFRTLQLCCF